jgi:very-short-patch-repair endonuclease
VPEVLGAAARILAAQQSLITTRQAASVGIDRERCRSLVHQRIWERIDHGVYGPLGVPLTWKRQLMAALRDWLDRYVDVGGMPESALEQVALDAFLDAGLHPVAQLWVEVGGGTRYRLDLAFPDRMIAVEVDGSQHEERPAQEADAIRDAALEALGWTVIRIRSTFTADLARAIQILVVMTRPRGRTR